MIIFKQVLLNSAKVIVPVIYQHIQFKTLIDVGCGRGAWLSVFDTISDVTCFGMDGDYVASEHLMMTNPDNFITADLNEHLPIIRKNMM